AAGVRARVLFMIVCLAGHMVLCQLFYFHFMYARPNWLDPIWGANHVKGLDGGPLGFLAWCVPQLLGSLAYDCVAGRGSANAWPRLAAWGVLLMIVGYGLSCLAMLYPATQPPAIKEGSIQVADSPVLPLSWTFTADDWRGCLADPPFVQPAGDRQRQLNYW